LADCALLLANTACIAVGMRDPLVARRSYARRDTHECGTGSSG
jgi:hypothetical protein